MFPRTGRRGTGATLVIIVALALSGTVVGSANSAAVRSAASKSACIGMVGAFQSDVIAADTAQAAGDGVSEATWRSAAYRAASGWLQSGCFSSGS
jgi:hypothetical protein